MVRYLAALAVCLFVFSSCKGEKSSESVYDIVSRTSVVPEAKQYKIIGKVECPKCRPYYEMMINLVNKDGLALIPSPWNRTFDNGDFAIEAELTPNSEVNLIVQIAYVNQSGLTEEVDIPEDNSEPIEVVVTVP